MSQSSAPSHQHTVVETLQSLIVAFVLAMIFRGFVTEGFVIPTGSMAPTLLGEHLAVRGEQTGREFDLGYSADYKDLRTRLDFAADAMLGQDYPGTIAENTRVRPRMGDRILVLKALFPFFAPQRFDVVVFKNPTDPNGEAGNYIKRLIGLPGEALWLVDGDVFRTDDENADDWDSYEIQRKPDYIQRAVWQPVYDSDYPPSQPLRLSHPWIEPWIGRGWSRNDTIYDCETAEATELEWDIHRSPYIDDWTPYNGLISPHLRPPPMLVHDVRISMTVTAETTGLIAGADLAARGHVFRFRVGDGEASITIAPEDAAEGEGMTVTSKSSRATFSAGEPVSIELWHVDQRLAIYINRKLVTENRYDWAPPERLRNAIGFDADVRELAAELPTDPARISITSVGSPLTVKRLRIDRDLHYRLDRMRGAEKPPQPEFAHLFLPGSFALATHPDTIMKLGPDQFFMCGDNSAASKDSRTWGNPHPMVSSLLDPTPGVVPRELLLGKAWLVYFPSPLPLQDGGRAVIPNFGSLRFIR